MRHKREARVLAYEYMTPKEFAKQLMEEKNPLKRVEMYRAYINTHSAIYHNLVELELEELKKYGTQQKQLNLLQSK